MANKRMLSNLISSLLYGWLCAMRSRSKLIINFWYIILSYCKFKIWLLRTLSYEFAINISNYIINKIHTTIIKLLREEKMKGRQKKDKTISLKRVVIRVLSLFWCPIIIDDEQQVQPSSNLLFVYEMLWIVYNRIYQIFISTCWYKDMHSTPMHPI